MRNYADYISPQAQNAGGIVSARHVKGPGDGMSDSVDATIDGAKPAQLSTDEFVIPADVVSMLGNGSNDAGAKALEGMVNRIRQAATGRSQQQSKIDPSKFLLA